MTDQNTAPAKPTERLMQAWIYRDTWTLEEAVLLALGGSRDDEGAREALQSYSPLLEQTKRNGMLIGVPKEWLWWGEKNGLPYHTEWWLAITPECPIGYDGRHFAHCRSEMLSDAYLKQERKLITGWAKKPYWTPREAIDLSLNFHPFRADHWRGTAPEYGGTIRERENRHIMLERALEVGDVTEKAKPQDYILWLDKCGFFVSEAWRRAVGIIEISSETEKLSALAIKNAELRNELRAMTEQIEALPAPTTSALLDKQSKEIKKLRRENKLLKTDPEDPRERGAMATRINSLQKALLAAAVDGLGYDPRRRKTNVARQIADKSDELGCKLTAQTVSRHLKESADEHVSQDTWEALFPTK